MTLQGGGTGEDVGWGDAGGEEPGDAGGAGEAEATRRRDAGARPEGSVAAR